MRHTTATYDVRDRVVLATAEVWRTAHLPEHPLETLRGCLCVMRQEGLELFREVKQDRARLKNPNRFHSTAIQQRGNVSNLD